MSESPTTSIVDRPEEQREYPVTIKPMGRRRIKQMMWVFEAEAGAEVRV